jgi:hypothetical protein
MYDSTRITELAQIPEQESMNRRAQAQAEKRARREAHVAHAAAAVSSRSHRNPGARRFLGLVRALPESGDSGT